MPQLTEKACTKCRTVKPISDYYRRGGRLNGVSACTTCRKAYRAEYNKLNREKQRTYTREYRAELRSQALTVLGNACAGCGISDARLLHIDHKLGGGTKERSAIQNTGICQKILAGSSEYQLLCANCNWLKRFTNNETPHRETA